MRIAIIGLGSMGKSVKEIAESKGHKVDITIDPNNKEATHKTTNEAPLEDVDLVVDFSESSSIIENAKRVALAKKNLVIGTTGWYEKLPEIEKIAKENDIGIMWSANFSIGVNMYYQIIAKAGELINEYDEYDIWGTELHHKNKSDSPSGTAKEIAKILLEKIGRKSEVFYDKLDRKIEPNEIHFSSTRGGPVNFSHTVGFDSASDTITITHSARDRGGYALGAVKAIEWMENKKGLFNMNDFLNEK
ncbi:MAG: Dihydrodipicolinate reductase [Candidatus Nomurabacteria bacterium GW2011_GWF2_35_66]|uniref:4-hydroxy-tetrahydrodipicolinate reductase n=1 Tax=Candidatus Nomurabacteria bacterium GW2011_GWE1_35_16 TaxID=1618761 RepID=A0A0G0BSX4_9BACT|nr:MAG: Dihydrodipicolinate reductase [Candidatus Nomurabacteria bacterium GW2011_GWF1_34_20]KKP63624.1 MAG: Dihydrodipicolinate reductase [Candidatus Nomurabacteria bacterium GW2011_GWE2_34_25]KKP66826.1 MAG: Dihydrodipicolinate reductase [Candidatus Nomurabacteria bacterium GW2011_GWE1_35_16]KKP83452.1 MAG: Dihydrodipicolinate reductase [Candidatus Nomurabacteria bacterium GW2011_GWF2_35_66]HAE36616.1 4-hydroxy-tetrahydrodipicolinate reductase [Candidatus Nomurabacteria bacterium]